MHGRKSAILVGSDARARSIFGQGVASGLVKLRVAATVPEAVSRAETRSPDPFVIALDDGETAIGGMRALRETHADAKVVVLCADGTASSVLAGLREHALAFLRSPWTVSDAREAISRALSLQNWEDGIEVLSARP